MSAELQAKVERVLALLERRMPANARGVEITLEAWKKLPFAVRRGQFMEFTGLDKDALRDAIASKRVQPFEVGDQVRFRKSEMLQYFLPVDMVQRVLKGEM